MIKEFKRALKENGQSITWFYKKFGIREKVGIGYSGFCHQLNDLCPLSEAAEKEIKKYLEK